MTISDCARQKLVTDEELEKALDWLRDNAAVIGEAKARLVKAGHMIKHTEALLYKASSEKTVDARKAEVRCSQRWIDVTNEEAVAAGEYETLKGLREAAELKIEAWRSEQANFRAMKI